MRSTILTICAVIIAGSCVFGVVEKMQETAREMQETARAKRAAQNVEDLRQAAEFRRFWVNDIQQERLPRESQIAQVSAVEEEYRIACEAIKVGDSSKIALFLRRAVNHLQPGAYSEDQLTGESK